jgi:hypothetical protein
MYHPSLNLWPLAHFSPLSLLRWPHRVTMSDAWDGNATQVDDTKLPNDGPYFRTYEIMLIVIFSVVSGAASLSLPLSHRHNLRLWARCPIFHSHACDRRDVPIDSGLLCGGTLQTRANPEAIWRSAAVPRQPQHETKRHGTAPSATPTACKTSRSVQRCRPNVQHCCSQ